MKELNNDIGYVILRKKELVQQKRVFQGLFRKIYKSDADTVSTDSIKVKREIK